MSSRQVSSLARGGLVAVCFVCLLRSYQVLHVETSLGEAPSMNRTLPRAELWLCLSALSLISPHCSSLKPSSRPRGSYWAWRAEERCQCITHTCVCVPYVMGENRSALIFPGSPSCLCSQLFPSHFQNMPHRPLYLVLGAVRMFACVLITSCLDSCRPLAFMKTVLHKPQDSGMNQGTRAGKRCLSRNQASWGWSRVSSAVPRCSLALDT